VALWLGLRENVRQSYYVSFVRVQELVTVLASQIGGIASVSNKSP